MEDAMVINKSSVERGFGHGAIYASEVFIDLVLFLFIYLFNNIKFILVN